MFDHAAELHGGSLAAIAAALTVTSGMQPKVGSFGKMLAIYANECAISAADLTALRADIATYVKVSADQQGEIERLRSALGVCVAALDGALPFIRIVARNECRDPSEIEQYTKARVARGAAKAAIEGS
jgi:hypothetical protein